MIVNFKKLTENAVQPARTAESGAGFNLTATEITTEVNERGQLILVYHTGISVEVPEGYEAIVRPVRSIAGTTLRMINANVIIGEEKDNEVVCRFVSTTDVVPGVYKQGDVFAQLVFNKIEDITLEELKQETSAASGSQSLPEDKDESTNSETAQQQAAGENAPEQA